jgi:hypothetical protein
MAREQGKKKQEAQMSKPTSSGAVEEAAATETEQCLHLAIVASRAAVTHRVRAELEARREPQLHRTPR